MNSQRDADLQAREMRERARAALEVAVLRGWRAAPENVDALARRLGVSRNVVRRILVAHGIAIPRGGRKAL